MIYYGYNRVSTKVSMKIEVITTLNSFANSMDYISKKFL